MSKMSDVLSAEISRLARKEVKKNTDVLHQTIRELRRKVSHISKTLAETERKMHRGFAACSSLPTEALKDTTRLSPSLLKKLRNRLGISQSELATLVGVSQPAVASWEQHRANPRGRTRAQIVALRGMTPPQVRHKLDEIAKSAPDKSKKKPRRPRKAKKKPSRS